MNFRSLNKFLICLMIAITGLSLKVNAQNRLINITVQYVNKPLKDIEIIVQASKANQVVLDTIIKTGFNGLASVSLDPKNDTIRVSLSAGDCDGTVMGQEFEMTNNSPRTFNLSFNYCDLRTRCWDLNANNLCDFSTEDINKDSFCDSLDCLFQCEPKFENSSNGTSITLSNRTTNILTGTSFKWTFGDGATSSFASPVHSYAKAGSYTVCLERTDTAQSCIPPFTKSCKSLLVKSDTACAPDFSYQIDLTGNLVYFKNASTGGIGTSAYKWSFGDGNSSILENPVKVYAQTGKYLVCLEQRTDSCIAQYCDSIDILNQAYSCEDSRFSVNDYLDNGALNIEFTANNDYHWLDYNWDFGNGKTYNGTSEITTFAFPGPYQSCLSIYSHIEHCRDSSCTQVNVPDTSKYCKSAFTFTRTSLLGFSFMNNSKNLNSSFRYVWNFGDNTNSTQESPTHVYPSFGLNKTYNVCLKISGTDPAGLGLDCSDASCQQVFVSSIEEEGFYGDEDQLLLYPNPVKAGESCMVQLVDRRMIEEILILSMEGKILQREMEGSRRSNHIEMTIPNHGTYMLLIKTQDQRILRKALIVYP